jgi:hypothetical protein
LHGSALVACLCHACHLEWLALGRPLHLAAANALHANALSLYRAVNDHLDALQIGSERPPADAGNLPADAAQVFGLASASDLVSKAGFFAANGAVHAHDAYSSFKTLRDEKLSIPAWLRRTSRKIADAA